MSQENARHRLSRTADLYPRASTSACHYFPGFPIRLISPIFFTVPVKTVNVLSAICGACPGPEFVVLFSSYRDTPPARLRMRLVHERHPRRTDFRLLGRSSVSVTDCRDARPANRRKERLRVGTRCEQ